MRAISSIKKLNRHAFCLLSSRPPIIYLHDWLIKYHSFPMSVIFELLRRRRSYFFISPSWSHESERLVSQASERIHRHRRRLGDHRFTYLCNTPQEVDLFCRAGIDAVFCNQNAFLDEGIFFPDPGAEKRFDAVYDASFIAYKRHHLAVRIKSLALSGYTKTDSEKTYTEGLSELFPHAHWFKQPGRRTDSWVEDSVVNTYLNACRVGICLSEIEGAMYASAQYLLAGLPVVTTHNRGGRDVFFHPDYVRWVEDDPEEIAAEVEELAADPPDAHEVRSRALSLMSEHRSRLVDLINEIYRCEGRRSPWADRWPAGLPNKLFDTRHTPSQVLRALIGGQPLWPKTGG